VEPISVSELPPVIELTLEPEAERIPKGIEPILEIDRIPTTTVEPENILLSSVIIDSLISDPLLPVKLISLPSLPILGAKLPLEHWDSR